LFCLEVNVVFEVANSFIPRNVVSALGKIFPGIDFRCLPKWD